MEKLLKRVTKDRAIPINITRLEYFKDRMEKYRGLYATEQVIKELNELTQGECGKNYEDLTPKEVRRVIQYLNGVEKAVIEDIRKTKGIKELSLVDHKRYEPVVTGISKQDIFKERNIGEIFLGIDMEKANYNILKRFSEDITLGSTTYEEMIGTYTTYEYLKNSKYIRQIIFGNNNPKRQKMLQKYYMSKEIENLIEKNILKKEDIVNFTPDEFVINLRNLGVEGRDAILEEINNRRELPLRTEYYVLRGIHEITDKGSEVIGYLKDYIRSEKVEIKSVSQDRMIYVVQSLNGAKLTEEDTLFMSGKDLLQMVEPPIISVSTMKN